MSVFKRSPQKYVGYWMMNVPHTTAHCLVVLKCVKSFCLSGARAIVIKCDSQWHIKQANPLTHTPSVRMYHIWMLKCKKKARHTNTWPPENPESTWCDRHSAARWCRCCWKYSTAESPNTCKYAWIVAIASRSVECGFCFVCICNDGAVQNTVCGLYSRAVWINLYKH